jgi:hypothetical protein
MNSERVMPKKTVTDDWVELQRIVSFKEAIRLSGLSRDTLKRKYRDKIIKLSPRRLGMRLGDVLSLNYQPTD